MKRYALFVLSALAAWGQKAGAPSFEVASIKQSPPPDGRGMRVGCMGGPGGTDPGRITCTNLDLANLVTMAYGIARYQLSGLSGGAPERFEMAVKLPEGTTKEQVPLMWQNLLAERFKLVVHREQKEMPRYELVLAKSGSKMQESVEEPPKPADAPQPPGPDRPPRPRPTLGSDGFPDLPPGTTMAMMGNKARWRGLKQTSGQIASMLGAQLGQPVTDSTGLTGKFDFVLSWVTGPGSRRGVATTSQPDGGTLLDTEDGPTLIEAVQSQLGLKLEQKKGLVEMLVVDHIEKVPTEN